MIETVEVSSVEQYEDVCTDFARRGKTYFRGQVNDYPQVLPSLFRTGAITDSEFQKLICGLYISCYNIGDWHEIHQKEIERFNENYPDPIPGIFNLSPGGINFNWQFPSERPFKQSWFNYDLDEFIERVRESFEKDWTKHSDALLQHYGVPSRALDITDDPLVALWFATNAFRRNPDQTATFVPTDGQKRIVYVFRDPKTEVINLQLIASAADFGFKGVEEIPYFGLRGIAQKGLLLLGATKDRPDLREHVSAVICLMPGEWCTGTLASRRYDYRTIIPPPDIDRFYAALLRERATTKSEFKKIAQQVIVYV
jgi:hypothetical protein